MKSLISEIMDKEEAACAVAKFFEVPVSRIESIDVYGKQIEAALNGKYYYFVINVKGLIKLPSCSNKIYNDSKSYQRNNEYTNPNAEV